MDIMELLKTRRTYRRFKQDPVPDSVVEDILTAARYASSAANKQPLSFVVVKSPEMVKKTFSDRKSTRLNSSHVSESRMPSSA